MDRIVENLKNLNICILTSYGHNGIDWAHSLLDNHKEILIMPAFSFFRSIETIKRRNKKISFKKKNCSKDIAKAFGDLFFLDPRHQTQRRNFIKNVKEKESFENYLYDWLILSKEKNIFKNLFLGIHYAYAKLYNVDLQVKKILIHQEHVSWHSEKYEKIFNPQFIFMMRDPRASIAGSILRMQKHNNDQIFSNQFDHVLLNWKSADQFVKNRINLTNKIYIAKNENLHKNLKYEMEKLSKWLNINFSETLLNQTFNGKEWFGESAYLQDQNQEKDLNKYTKTNFYNPEEVTKRWKKVLDKKKTLMIEVIFNNIFYFFNYKFEYKHSFKDIVKAYLYFFTNFNYQKKYFLSKFLIIPRNILRRLLIILNPKVGKKMTNFL